MYAVTIRPAALAVTLAAILAISPATAQRADICYIIGVVADGAGVRIRFTRSVLYADNGNRHFRILEDGRLHELDRATSSWQAVDGLPAAVGDTVSVVGGVHDDCRLTVVVVDGVTGVRATASSRPHGFPEGRAEAFIAAERAKP